MSQPAQKPPQAGGDHSALCIVGDDLLPRIDPGPLELFREDARIRQRMPAIASGFRGGEILVEGQEARPGDVRSGVFGPAAPRIGEIVAAVEHDPIGIGKIPRKNFVAGERGEDHAVILPALAARAERVRVYDLAPISGSEVPGQPAADVFVEVHHSVFHRRLVRADFVLAAIV